MTAISAAAEQVCNHAGVREKTSAWAARPGPLAPQWESHPVQVQDMKP